MDSAAAAKKVDLPTFKSLGKPAMQKVLRARGQAVSGTKPELVSRFEKAVATETEEEDDEANVTAGVDEQADVTSDDESKGSLLARVVIDYSISKPTRDCLRRLSFPNNCRQKAAS